jgi:response regulator RpfG family c-di-GMP phosphodiesterase
VQLTFAEQALTAATANREDVTERNRIVAADRLQRDGELLVGARILWVDDSPKNNFNERTLFERAGARIDPALSTRDAITATRLHPYDLIISDWKRPEGENAGPDLLKALHSEVTRRPSSFT